MTGSQAAPIGILGGTFDPIHLGHLRPALEVLQGLGLAELRLVPGHVPPHRPQPRLAAEQRCALLQLACDAIPGLEVDRRELERPGPSYTIDTLCELRRELGAQQSLVFVMGSDAFRTLPSWHQWRSLTDYAHLVVTTRGGDEGGRSPMLNDWLAEHRAVHPSDLRKVPAGKVWFHPVSRLEISATAIRRLLAQGYSAQGLMPDGVWRQVSAGLYGYPQI